MIDLYDYLYDIRNSLASKNKVGGRGGRGGANENWNLCSNEFFLSVKHLHTFS